MFARSSKLRKDIQKLHNVIHNTAARYGCSLTLKGTISDRPFQTSLFSEPPDFFAYSEVRGEGPGEGHKTFVLQNIVPSTTQKVGNILCCNLRRI